MELNDLLTRKADLERKLAEVEANIEASTNQDLTTIAEFIHSMQCRYNHTDGCGWYYEQDYNKNDAAKIWSQSAHLSYLRKAKKLMAFEDIVNPSLLETANREEIVASVLAALKSVW